MINENSIMVKLVLVFVVTKTPAYSYFLETSILLGSNVETATSSRDQISVFGPTAGEDCPNL